MNDCIIKKQTLEEQKEMLDALIKESMGRRERCILCKRLADLRGVWIPTSEWSQKLGSMPDKTRVIIYGICHRHMMTDANLKLIDEKILEGVQKGETNLANFSN